MTQSFDRSRLAEIAEAPPMPRVAFPGREEIAVMRRSLRRIRELLKRKGRESRASRREREPAAAARRLVSVG
ncbi:MULTISPECIES: hypothetical protein [unclassified Roseateles]|uniref:hypothetical protein n=1 Tax=Pelomonas sp. Root1237 TaxID=1736434 RepID=UPI000B2F1A63|nr:hypothetical protein [Pelomonas sp. Root1237]